MVNQLNHSAVNTYLDLMDSQREKMIAKIDGISQEQLWQQPTPGEWSIGEILHHNILLFRSMFPLVKFAWRRFHWLGKLLKNTAYKIEIEDPYRKQSFPHRLGFLWTPKYSEKNQVSLSTLLEETRLVHQEVRAFYEGKDETLLGHVYLFDPLFGFINLILTLQIGIYHDQLHYDDVIKQRQTFKE